MHQENCSAVCKGFGFSSAKGFYNHEPHVGVQHLAGMRVLVLMGTDRVQPLSGLTVCRALDLQMFSMRETGSAKHDVAQGASATPHVFVLVGGFFLFFVFLLAVPPGETGRELSCGGC